MSLTSGQKVGPYEVVALLDGGGQGDVYRARDTRLSRDVALKVLADGRDGARHRARFEREAQALAALNHPNIATLVGVEESPGILALVMELVEGESLAARLARADGRGLGADALPIARQIADALEAAHRSGLVHRDLKPANVMIRRDGTVKLVDFGLAKATRADVGAGAAAATVTETGTAGGAIGTAAYMSPEQARNGAVDNRSDIWAFGCLCYEMLTGRRAFAGETSSDALASVLTREPDMDALPPDTADGIRRLLRRCFVKDAANRLRDIGDARLEIEDALAAPSPSTRASSIAPRRVPWPRYALAALGSAAIAGAAAWLLLRPRPESRPVSRTSIVFPASAPFSGRLFGPNIALAADGSRIVYNSFRGFAVRTRDRLNVQVVEASGGLSVGPFLSPDGAWIGYFEGSDLKRVATAGGGPPRLVASVGPGASASWSDDGIVFADVWGLFRISPEGGAPEKLPMAKLDAGEQSAYPVALPGGRGVLFTVLPTRTISVRFSGRIADSRIEVLDTRTGRQRTVLRGASHARYLPSGHLVYTAGTTLAVAPFDLRTLDLAGPPTPLDIPGDAEFATADDGTLVYTTGTTPLPRTLVWVDHQGREEPLGAPTLNYLYPKLSPDGRRVALDVLERAERDIWIWDLQRRVLERFTVDPAGNPLAAWALDGSRLAFGSDRFGATNLFWQATDGSGTEERLLESPRLQMPLTFTPDGRLLFSEEVPGEGRNIRALRLDTRAVGDVIRTPTQELNAEISPDGRWIAYDSNESGQFEVYVRPYPGTAAARWQVSTGGGKQPLWSRDGRALYYREFSGALMSARVTPGATFSAAAAIRILDGGEYLGGGTLGSSRTYDVAADGRFLMLKMGARDGYAGPALVIVQNWFDELKRIAPTP